MTSYYEEILKLWEAEKYFEAISSFSKRLSEVLLSESEDFSKNLSDFWKIIEAECEENPKVTFSLYEMVKKVRNWDDKALCEKLKINKTDIVAVKIGCLKIVEGAGLRMLYELFPQMAV